MKVFLFTLLFSVMSIVQAEARKYEVPPSNSTTRSVPYIPDKEMERCVEIYNESTWLGEEIDKIQVDKYSEAEVNSYNAKVSKFTRMTDYFNKYCAGKQSESAYKAAQKLNQESNQ
jgi:hypothetical protein